MTARMYLENIRKMRMAIGSKKAKISVLRELATNTAASMTGMPRNPSGSKSPMANAVCKIADLERDVAVLEQKRQEAIDILCMMEDSDYCTVLIKRYVQEKAWEDIAAEMHCSRTQAFRLHTAAIENFEKFAKKVDGLVLDGT